METSPATRSCLPNAVYVGVARAGSTWLAENLASHPDAFVPTAKDVYFFDREYERGLDWYAEHFKRGCDRKIRIDISHDYLHVPIAADRIACDLPGATILACVREPVDWLRSIATYMSRNEPAGSTFQQVVSKDLGVVAGGFVSNYLDYWMQRVGRDALHVYTYDDLRNDPAQTLHDIQDVLGLSRHRPADVESRRNVPTRARSAVVAKAGKQLAGGLRRIGRPEILGWLKRNPIVARALYTERSVDLAIDDEAVATLRRFYRPEVTALSELLGRDLVELWGYDRA
ncbi:MAG: sulfotransferase domain-containing protein [Ilumatobacter sp.]|uniref:sulfotransferase domain-containing protein n=1 Tax=Ilumatobacter sp. TaxID=1967498 RepID=UPI00261A5A1D|nr:sulfotransferase domain-containing protein [Ilumatobacter sp.]MDJ0771451.1 sulfotransferase domain-containing protein [Ilumatobacter sp.]